MSIEEAKEVLRNAGYYVDSLWSTDDVRNNYNGNEDDFNLTEEECIEILDSVFGCDYVMQTINEFIAAEIPDNNELEEEE